MRTRWPGLAAAVSLTLMAAPQVAASAPADLCFELAPESITAAELPAVRASLEAAVATRPLLFPKPMIDEHGWRLDIAGGHGTTPSSDDSSCLEPGSEWTARFDRAFLQAGADLMLTEAPTTPGIDSEVEIEWDLGPGRLRTTLEFAGPFDIPNGTCWVDEQLSIEGVALSVSSEEGRRTSLFAEGACDRFFDHLPDGAAGEQAITLLPAEVELSDGSSLHFVAERIEVREDGLVASGALARD